MKRRAFLQAATAVPAILTGGLAIAGPRDYARYFVEKYSRRSMRWNGPQSGPPVSTGKRIAIILSDGSSGGVQGVLHGIKEASEAIGWDTDILAGNGTITMQVAAFGRVFKQKPDGIILVGLDLEECDYALTQAQEFGIPVVSWHGSSVIGPSPRYRVFANITADQMAVSRVAADWAFVNSNGNPGIVIFTDSTYSIAIAKANRMKEEIASLGGQILEYIDTPIAETATRMPEITRRLRLKYLGSWTHTLAVNDLYFQSMGIELEKASIQGDGYPLNISAGDGSVSAYKRIRSRQYQAATVAEPLNLQGWQLIDELNRAFAKEGWSGFISPFRLVTANNISYDGGPQNHFDPENGYRDAYCKLWGKA